MARLPRLTVTGYPHHVILRGNNRQDIFRTTADYQRMLDLLFEHSRSEDVDIHAYVLMSNHLHLLLTPQKDQALSKMMQAVGRSYVQAFNKAQGRTGTLWEGRYRSTLIQTERYLLACMAYIDLNPVRAHMVAQPEDYAWSSYGFYTGRRSDRLITPHALYWGLGNTPFAREAAYAELVQAGISADQQGALTDATLSGWALGDPDFKASLQAQTQRRLTKGRAGRPFAKPKTLPDASVSDVTSKTGLDI
jgi:putative transposase